MTTEDLMRRITAYYGPYPRSFTGKTTMAYVESEYNDVERDELWRRLIREFSTEYKVVPDVAVLTRIGRESRAEMKPAVPLLEERQIPLGEQADRLAEINHYLETIADGLKSNQKSRTGS